MRSYRASRPGGALSRSFVPAMLAFSVANACATGGDLDPETGAHAAGRSGAGRGGSAAAGRAGGAGVTAGVGGAGAAAGGAPSGGSAGAYGAVDGSVSGGSAGTGGTSGAASGGSAGAGGTNGTGSLGAGGTSGSVGAGGTNGTGSVGAGGGKLGAGGTGGMDAAVSGGSGGVAGTAGGMGDGCVAVTETCNGLDDDCDGTPDDVANPGAECGQRHPTATNVASWRCTSGACAIQSCTAGFANCDAAPANGCETNTNSDPSHCGNCTTVCSSTTPNCTSGSCTGSPPVGCPSGALICDTFEDGVADGWTPSGSWSVVSDGSFVYRATSAASSVRGASLGDQTVEARMKIVAFGGTSASYRAGIVARYTGGSNYYTLQIDPNGSLRVLKGTSTVTGCNDLPSGVSPLLNTWATLKLSVSGTGSNVHIVSSVNGVPKHDCTHTSGTLASGSAGLATVGANTQAEFDDFVVWSP